MSGLVTCLGVMEGLREGDFELFLAEVIGDAVSVATRVLEDQGLAEDAAVEAMARAHLRWRSLSADPYRRAWALRVAVNAAIDIQRSERRRRAREARAVTLVGGGEFEQESVDRVVLNAALAKLSRRQREAVALRYLAGLSEHDAAGAMDLSPGSLKVRLLALRGPDDHWCRPAARLPAHR